MLNTLTSNIETLPLSDKRYNLTLTAAIVLGKTRVFVRFKGVPDVSFCPDNLNTNTPTPTFMLFCTADGWPFDGFVGAPFYNPSHLIITPADVLEFRGLYTGEVPPDMKAGDTVCLSITVSGRLVAQRY
jgi:hypothetical protein